MERGSMKLEHEPGYVMFVDFAGKKLEFKDRHTGLDIQDLNRLVFLPDNNEKKLLILLSPDLKGSVNGFSDFL